MADVKTSTDERQLSILSIDDDHDIQDLIEAWLEKAGYRVFLASSYGEAVTILKNLKPALILLDVMMPEMDGYALCHKLKENEKFVDVPVIFLTSLTAEMDRAKAFAAGGVDFISKAEGREKLIPAVKKHIETGARWAQISATVPQKASGKEHLSFSSFKEFVISRLNGQGKDEAINSLVPGSMYEAKLTGLTSPQMAGYLAEYFGVPYITRIDPASVRLDELPTSFSRKNHVVAADNGAGEVVFILSDPFNLEVEDILRQACPPGKPLKLSITEPENIAGLLVYGAAMPGGKPDVGGAETAPKPEQSRAAADSVGSGVVRTADQLIERAVAQRASDIHIEPKAAHTSVRFRIDGDLHEVNKLDKETTAMLVSRLKALGAMDLAERRKPQDGAFEFTVGKKPFKLRLATTATPYGESLVMRLLEPSARVRSLQELGMTGVQVEHMLEFASRTQGMVLLVGPTGSGKTTTIYSFLSQIDCRTRSLISVEDPVEYTIPFANQQQVNPKGGATFEELLKSSVRQDPDLLFLGEIRDDFSAKIALDFASTGHLTVTSLHTSNATTAIFRLERLGVTRGEMADSILGVVAQRLLKKLCPHCRKVVETPPDVRERLSVFPYPVPERVALPVGCLRCDETGYRGREAISEIVKFYPEVSHLVRENRSIPEIRRFVQKRGDYLLSHHAIEKLGRFIFSPEDVFRNVLIEEVEYYRTTAAQKAGGSASLSAEGGPAGSFGGNTRFTGPRLFETPSAGIKTSPAGPEKRPAVLIADDDPDIRAVLSQYLTDGGYDVTAVASGIGALLELGKKEYALVISDIDMPEVDGFQLLEVMTQQDRRIPVILLTMLTGDEAKAKGLQLGAVDYIVKSSARNVILARVKNVLNKARMDITREGV